MSDGQMSRNVTVVMETEVRKKGDVIVSGEASYLSVLYFNKPPPHTHTLNALSDSQFSSVCYLWSLFLDDGAVGAIVAADVLATRSSFTIVVVHIVVVCQLEMARY